MSKIKLLEIRSEIAAGTRGASLGIDALRVASLNIGSAYFSKYTSSRIADRNDLLWEQIATPSAIRIEGLVEVYQNVSESVLSVLREGNFPVVLAADHASAGGTIIGIKRLFQISDWE